MINTFAHKGSPERDPSLLPKPGSLGKSTKLGKKTPAGRKTLLVVGEELQPRREMSVLINKGADKYQIFAYTGNTPTGYFSVEAAYKKAIAFFVGGAADKYSLLPPTRIVQRFVKNPFEFSIRDIRQDYLSSYLSFDEIYGQDNIAKNVLSLIQNKEGSAIFIIGHSLGGWSGAHLSKILWDDKYFIQLLVTVDPVGTDSEIQSSVELYPDKPDPRSAFWINIIAEPESPDFSDIIAWAGGKWTPSKSQPSVTIVTPYHHGNAGDMFNAPDDKSLSASNYCLFYFNNYLQAQ